MDGYRLQIDELGKLIGELETAADRMTDANKQLSSFSGVSHLGSATLAKAGADFEESWDYGIEQLGKASEDITERLKKAKSKYEELERKYSDVFRSIGGADGGKIVGADTGGGIVGAPGELNSPPGPEGGGYTGGMPKSRLQHMLDGATPEGGGITGGMSEKQLQQMAEDVDR
ncbi:hypothetical protein [Amycolatopsis sp. CA-230715]|uniref:hypothetical protein n=1 Tax=Amycolatopsis sp. CA-230715 TaxID=2745196 RepID=UPI001C0160C6|nr:hypothetical protein [Amycolatopsis sp. CA-230715]